MTDAPNAHTPTAETAHMDVIVSQVREVLFGYVSPSALKVVAGLIEQARRLGQVEGVRAASAAQVDGPARRQAIDVLVGAWMQRDQEFCVGAAELNQSEAEMYAAFAALGVTREEVDHDG